MRLIVATCIVAGVLPGLALAQQAKPTHSGRGGQSMISNGTGGNRTPGENAVPKGRGKSGVQPQQQGNSKQ